MSPSTPTRRRFLSITAAAGALALACPRAAAARGQFHDWSGTALGATASMRLWHADAGVAAQANEDSMAEIARLESLFSLFRPDSQVSRLNREGVLDAPDPDLVDLLRLAHDVSVLSDGAFDVTVQPLWRLHADHAARYPESAHGPEAGALDRARARVGFRNLRVDKDRVAFAEPGMAITLNGIAQGYVTDRIADRLRAMGFDHVVVDLGEVRTLGSHPDGRPWRIGIKDPNRPWSLARTLPLRDAAVATSGGYAHRFGRTRHHHLFDPRAGTSAGTVLDATVSGPRATEADALSTALAVLGTDGARLMRDFPAFRATVTGPGGRRRAL